MIEMTQSEETSPDRLHMAEQRRRLVALEGLWDDVLRARLDVAQERHDPQHHAGPTSRIALVGALEAYLEGICELRYPPPFPLVNELRMQRLACPGYPAA